MTRYGYFLACEEFTPRELLEQARMAEQAGFSALAVSDHYHPWTGEQGESSFVWSVIGALSQVTSLPVTTLVTCPTVRMHPALNAQAAATAAALLDGGFRFGVGSGEALNEHITGAPWPDAPTRAAMLEEAVEIIRELFTGKRVTHRGPHYTVENARLYTLPDTPPPVYVSGFGPHAAALAGRIGDGFVTMTPDAGLVGAFRDGGGGAKPVIGGLKVCWDPDREHAVDTVHRLWATERLPGEINQILPTPEHFQQARTMVDRDTTASSGTFGADPDEHIASIRAYADAGFDEVYVGQVGPDQQRFFAGYHDQVLPALHDTMQAA